ncbi:GTP 3',8-cyclase MoaA [Bordetella holmesii]|uniref:GTP 3',8-cyclase n=1 Tax=Bordetella holmesii CDC-H585-BH TaxID=1331206 RepID=A0A158M535_9BORD|nr:GTP 3',8-cyclase MoaA [Bordetella holmesii]AMD46337.1 cyclic pyranopterin phosphate synthase MoaA [Bordetella holmesii H558]AMD48271.1 molybdenum cofactor biosynthesis protein MoeA [Bordetella holmesii F627]AOB35230.1 cyclic pyranopterin phosphate synthase [Bordetella holmesii]AUL19219.1 cyclic pyranopterin phosphate synthase MoaA [Bordetella holmesii]AUL22553.1 cyclic pyranopterin phosphate synthase MoaA [Bordetella holmesii]
MASVIYLADERPAAITPPREGEPVRDRRARPLRDLRISVTDRCNFRCTYCMPREIFDANYRFMPHSALLSFEEITRAARIFVRLGVEKIRLTGGEPLLRKDVDKLIAMLAQLRTPQGQPLDLTLTTNASLLARKAEALKAAGLSRVTVSLDALDPARFARLADSTYTPDDVLHGIDAAARAGLPVKVNMVVRRGLNDDEILPMARRFRHSGHVLRFIEYMDVGNSNGWNVAEVLPSDELLARLGEQFELQPIDDAPMGRVAERWRYADGAGEIGVISSVTHAFCGGCTRARLSPEGQLFLCLFASRGHDVRGLLRGLTRDEDVAAALAGVWSVRDDNYSERRGLATTQREKIEMSYIGG